MQTIKISITDSEKQALHALAIARKKPIADFIREAIDTYLAAADVSFQESLKLTHGLCPDFPSPDRKEWNVRAERVSENDHDLV